MDVSLWRYIPKDAASFFILAEPDLGCPRVQAVLQPGEVFGVSEELQGPSGLLFLRLTDGRGWVLDVDPKLGVLCEREHAQRSLEELGAQMLVGTWRYGNKGGKYQISLTKWGQLRFDEQPPSGRRAYGFLEPCDGWFQADLNYHDGEPGGTIRLCYMEDQAAILSNFRSPGKSDWQPDLTSHKRRQTLPTVLENDVGSNEQTALRCEGERERRHSIQKEKYLLEEEGEQVAVQERENWDPNGRGNAAHGKAEEAGMQVAANAAHEGDTQLNQSCPPVQGKPAAEGGLPGSVSASVMANRHADMVMQLLREAQRDRDVTQQRLVEAEAENTQLRQSLQARETQNKDLEAERDLLVAQLRESRAQVEGLMAICRDPRAALPPPTSLAPIPVQVEETHRPPQRTSAPGTPVGGASRTWTESREARPELRTDERKAAVTGRGQQQATRSFEGLPAKSTFEAIPSAKSYDGVPCNRAAAAPAPSSPPTPFNPRILKTVPQPVRIIQVPTPVRSNVRVASRDRARYSWQSPPARACSPGGC